MNAHPNVALLAAGCLSAAAAVLHLLIIVKGARWYRFFGAGERMARAAEAGRAYPAVVTVAIAAMLALWAAYAFSGAGLLAPLPHVRAALCLIAAIYLVRGLVLVPVLLMPRTRATTFGLWSSSICLVFAAAHVLGLSQAWQQLAISPT